MDTDLHIQNQTETEREEKEKKRAERSSKKESEKFIVRVHRSRPFQVIADVPEENYVIINV